MFTEAALDHLLPNPYRQLTKYPLDEDRIKRLAQSITDTTFWDNIVVRPVADKPGYFELAYGHHRVEAARRVLGKGAKVNVIVRNVDDGMMLRMMANENADLRGDVGFLLETVEAALHYLGEQVAVRNKASKHSKTKGAGGHRRKVALAPQIHALVGGSHHRVCCALAMLTSIKSGLLSREAIEHLGSTEAAERFHVQLKNAEVIGRPVSLREQRHIAQEAVKAAKVTKHRRLRDHVAARMHPYVAEPIDDMRQLVATAASSAHSLDVALSELDRQRQQFYSNGYHRSIEALSLATHCQSISKLMQRVFQPPKRLESAAATVAAKEE